MSLFIFIPLVIVAAALIIFLSRKTDKRTTSGMGSRPDYKEPPELRGTEQYKTRAGSGTSVPPEG
jgi:hypothetical protein